MRQYIIQLILIALPLFVIGQEVPTPGAPQEGSILLLGGTAHIGNGDVIENSAIAFVDGKITLVADATTIKLDMSKFDEVINIQGKHVYPGLIAADTKLGLTEIDAVRATRDFNEVGSINPNVRSIIAYNTDSRVVPTIRFNGVLLAQIAPSGGRISGTSSVVQLDAWNWEDAAYSIDEGIFLNWPARFSWTGWWTGNPSVQKSENYESQVQEIHDYMTECKAYANNPSPAETNLKFEAMKGLFNGNKKLYIRVSDAQEILSAVAMIEKFDLDAVLVGCAEAYMVTDVLTDKQIPVLLDATFSLPQRKDEDIDIRHKMPKILADAGVPFGLHVSGGWEVRVLPFAAGYAAAYGLSKEDALRSVTLSVAEILGIDDVTGSLEEGKDANILVSEGDVLDMLGNDIEYAFIQGRQLDVTDKQEQLYLKYAEKYGIPVE